MAGGVGEVVQLDWVADFEFIKSYFGTVGDEIGGVGHGKRPAANGDLFRDQVERFNFATGKWIMIDTVLRPS